MRSFIVLIVVVLLDHFKIPTPNFWMMMLILLSGAVAAYQDFKESSL